MPRVGSESFNISMQYLESNGCPKQVNLIIIITEIVVKHLIRFHIKDCLATKEKYYGIQGNLLNWITEWMIKRQQRVVLDNKVSDFLPVKSGIPQGTVLGPLMFILYINDIDQNISTTNRLFADDCIMYRIPYSGYNLRGAISANHQIFHLEVIFAVIKFANHSMVLCGQINLCA